MNEERLNELMTLWDQGVGISNEEMAKVFAAARRCNELEAENAALKDVNWDISYPDGESLATIKAERDALKKRLEVEGDYPDYDGIYCRDVTIKEQDKKIDTLRANNAALREAAHFLLDRLEEFEINDDADDMAREFLGHVQPAHERLSITLARTSADSLREYRNGVLEEVDKRILTCCSVCSDGVVNGQDCPSCTVLRLTVRAMKEADNDSA